MKRKIRQALAESDSAIPFAYLVKSGFDDSLLEERAATGRGDKW